MKPQLVFTLSLSAFIFSSLAPARAGDSVGQPAEERAAQKHLPQSNDPIWAILKTTRVSEDAVHGRFTAVASEQVKALVGQTVKLTGFMLPLETQSKTRHFLLSKYTPVCFFCPPGAPNEVIEVRSARAIKAGYDKITVAGQFALQNDGEKGLFFRLDQADLAH